MSPEELALLNILLGAAIALVGMVTGNWFAKDRDSINYARTTTAERNRVLLDKLELLVSAVSELERTIEDYGGALRLQLTELGQSGGGTRGAAAAELQGNVFRLIARATWLQQMYFPQLQPQIEQLSEATRRYGLWASSELRSALENPASFKANQVVDSPFARRGNEVLTDVWKARKETVDAARKESQNLLPQNKD